MGFRRIADDHYSTSIDLLELRYLVFVLTIKFYIFNAYWAAIFLCLSSQSPE